MNNAQHSIEKHDLAPAPVIVHAQLSSLFYCVYRRWRRCSISKETSHVLVRLCLPLLIRRLLLPLLLEKKTLNQFSKSFPQPCRKIAFLTQLLEISHRTLPAHVAKRMQKLLFLIGE